MSIWASSEDEHASSLRMHVQVALVYLGASGLVGLAVTYYYDSEANTKLQNILKYGLKLLGLALTATSTSMPEASIALTSCLLALDVAVQARGFRSGSCSSLLNVSKAFSCPAAGVYICGLIGTSGTACHCCHRCLSGARSSLVMFESPPSLSMPLHGTAKRTKALRIFFFTCLVGVIFAWALA